MGSEQIAALGLSEFLPFVISSVARAQALQQSPNHDNEDSRAFPDAGSLSFRAVGRTGSGLWTPFSEIIVSSITHSLWHGEEHRPRCVAAFTRFNVKLHSYSGFQTTGPLQWPQVAISWSHFAHSDTPGGFKRVGRI